MKSLAILLVLATVGGGVVGASPITRSEQSTELTDASMLTRSPRCCKRLETPRRHQRPSAPDRPPAIITSITAVEPPVRAFVDVTRPTPRTFETSVTSATQARAPPVSV